MRKFFVVLFSCLLLAGCSNEGLPAKEAPAFKTAAADGLRTLANTDKTIVIEEEVVIVSGTALSTKSEDIKKLKESAEKPLTSKFINVEDGSKMKVEYTVQHGDAKSMSAVMKNKKAFAAVNGQWGRIDESVANNLQNNLDNNWKVMAQWLDENNGKLEAKSYVGPDINGPTWWYKVRLAPSSNDVLMTQFAKDFSLEVIIGEDGRLRSLETEGTINFVDYNKAAGNSSSEDADSAYTKLYTMLEEGLRKATVKGALASMKIKLSMTVTEAGADFETPRSQKTVSVKQLEEAHRENSQWLPFASTPQLLSMESQNQLPGFENNTGSNEMLTEPEKFK